jgi:hypothetical protein
MVRTKRGIPFIGALTLFITLAVINPLAMGQDTKLHLTMMTEIMLFLYFMIALATERYTGVTGLVQRIWDINTNGDSQDAKYTLIKSFIEISVHEWDEYWQLYQELVDGKPRSGRIKRTLMRIPKGNVSPMQFTWISIYVGYSIIRTSVFPMFNADLAFMIEFITFGYFIILSNGIVGMKEFMSNVFKSFQGKDNIEQSLNLLESRIIYGASTYGFLKGKIDMHKEEKKKGKQ